MIFSTRASIATAFTLAVLSCPAGATTITDWANDFLGSFVGTKSADLDILNFSVDFDAGSSRFRITAGFGGHIATESPGLYVIGVDTGTGINAPFGGIGAPNVAFNQVVLIQKNGTGTVSGASGGPLAAGSIDIENNIFTAWVPLALLPSTGSSPEQFRFSLWSRNGVGNNNQVADFAPGNGTITVGGVPEPASWLMMVTAFGFVGLASRRLRQRAAGTVIAG